MTERRRDEEPDHQDPGSERDDALSASALP